MDVCYTRRVASGAVVLSEADQLGKRVLSTEEILWMEGWINTGFALVSQFRCSLRDWIRNAGIQ